MKNKSKGFGSVFPEHVKALSTFENLQSRLEISTPIYEDLLSQFEKSLSAFEALKSNIPDFGVVEHTAALFENLGVAQSSGEIAMQLANGSKAITDLHLTPLEQSVLEWPLSRIEESKDAIDSVISAYTNTNAVDLSSDTLTNLASSLANINELDGVSENFLSLTNANQSIAELILNTHSEKNAFADLFTNDIEFHDNLELFGKTEPYSSAFDFVSSHESELFLNNSLKVQSELLELERLEIGSELNLTAGVTRTLTENLGSLSQSYCDLIEVVPDLQQDKFAFVTEYAPTEFHLELDVLRRISTPRDEQEKPKADTRIGSELAEFDQELFRMLSGAKEALTSSNPEKTRHISTSLREFFTHLIHRLAPDRHINKWSDEPSFYHNDKPTRAARLRYIYRHISEKPLKKYIEEDVNSTLILIDVLQSGVHKSTSNFSHYQLEAVILRVESLATGLLKASKIDA